MSFWNSLARLEYFGGNTDAALLRAARSVPGQRLPVDPEGCQHPVLAQIFINWRLGTDVQFPNAWPIDHGPWSELSEGFLGPSTRTRSPTGSRPTTTPTTRPSSRSRPSFKSVDWDAYNAGAEEWQDYYAEQLGL